MPVGRLILDRRRHSRLKHPLLLLSAATHCFWGRWPDSSMLVGNPEVIPRMSNKNEHCRRKAIHSTAPLASLGWPMPEDSSAPNCGAGGSQCNAEVWH